MKKEKQRAINQTDIAILKASHVFLDHTWQRQNVSDTFTRLYYVKDGHGFLKTEVGSVPLSGGYAYVIPANHCFSYGCDSLEKIYFHIHATGTEKYDILSALPGISRMPFSAEAFSELRSLYMSDDFGSFLKLKAVLYETVRQAAALLPAIPRRQYSVTVEDALGYIRRHASAALTVNQLAAILYISPVTLRKKFKDEVGMPIGQYMDNFIFAEAQRLLADKDISIERAADHLGFCDRFYFSRRFKEKTGMTPAMYRKQLTT